MHAARRRYPTSRSTGAPRRPKGAGSGHGNPTKPPADGPRDRGTPRSRHAPAPRRQDESAAPAAPIAITAASATITVDGDTSDWEAIEGTVVNLEQIRLADLDPEQAAEIEFGEVAPIDVSLKVASDAENLYMLVEVPTAFVYDAEDHNLSPALAVQFLIDEGAGEHMGVDEADLYASTGMVDLWHWELDCQPGATSGGQGIPGGEDPACKLDDEYATTPEKREDDGGGDTENRRGGEQPDGCLDAHGRRGRSRCRGDVGLRDVPTAADRRPAGCPVRERRCREGRSGLVRSHGGSPGAGAIPGTSTAATTAGSRWPCRRAHGDHREVIVGRVPLDRHRLPVDLADPCVPSAIDSQGSTDLVTDSREAAEPGPATRMARLLSLPARRLTLPPRRWMSSRRRFVLRALAGDRCAHRRPGRHPRRRLRGHALLPGEDAAAAAPRDGAADPPLGCLGSGWRARRLRRRRATAGAPAAAGHGRLGHGDGPARRVRRAADGVRGRRLRHPLHPPRLPAVVSAVARAASSAPVTAGRSTSTAR